MPRQAKVAERTHRQINDQETFDFTTPNFKGASRPVDAYARPGDAPRVLEDPDVRLFQQSLGNMQDALHNFAGIKKAQNKEEKEAGAAAAARREQRPADASEAFIMGHELVSGKASASALEEALAGHYDSAKDADPATFKRGQDKVLREFLAGRSDAFVDGIMSDAINLEQKYSGAYQAYTTKKVKADGLSKLAAGVEYDAKQLLEATTIPSEEKAKALRDMISGAQVIGAGTYRLSKLEVSDHLVDVIGRLAKDAGQPELMKFAFVPDKDGIRLADHPALAKQIAAWTNHAEQVRETTTRELEKRVAKQQLQVENRVGNKIMEMLLDGNSDIRGAHDLLRSYSDPTRNPEGVMLNPSMVEHAHKLIANRGAGYALQSNPRVLAEATAQAASGKLGVSQLLAMKGQLEESDFKSILSMNVREASHGENGKSQIRRDFDKRVSSNKAIAKQVDGITGRLLDANGPTRAAFVESEALSWFYEFTEREKREPSAEEQSKYLKGLIDDSFRLYGQNPTGFGNTSGVAPVPSGKAPAPTLPAPQPQSGLKRQVPEQGLRNAFERAKQKRGTDAEKNRPKNLTDLVTGGS